MTFVTGGVEFFSDLPIRYSRPVRQRLLAMPKAMKKGPMGMLELAKGLKLSDLAPESKP
jgi:acetyl-CoA acyltransferase